MSNVKKSTSRLDGHFLEKDLYKYASGERRVAVVYLETPTKRTVLFAEEFSSHDQLYEAMVNGNLSEKLSARARELVPAIGIREEQNLAMMKDQPFEPLDVWCSCCGARPGELCVGGKHAEDCKENRAEALQSFLIWLAEQRFAEAGMTKKRIRSVVEMMGYDVQNPYSDSPQVVIEYASTGDRWGIYVGGRMDVTKSVWMTCGSDMSDPERGPFRNELELALGLSALRRGQ